MAATSLPFHLLIDQIDYTAANLSANVGSKISTVTATTGAVTIASQDGAENFNFAFDVASGAIFTDGRTNPSGIQYNANYHADYTLRSLVDVEYVQNYVTNNSSDLIAGSGIDITGGAIHFGSTLTQAANLDLAGFDFNISTSGVGKWKAATDLEFTDAAAGIIFKTANGSLYRLTCDDN